MFICVCQGSSSVALLHKHLQLLLPHATDIYNRSTTLLRESSGNGSVREKLRGITISDNLAHVFKQMRNSSLMFSVCDYGRCDLHVCCGQYAVSDCDVLAVVACMGGTAAARLPPGPATPSGPSQQTSACRHSSGGAGASVASTW